MNLDQRRARHEFWKREHRYHRWRTFLMGSFATFLFFAGTMMILGMGIFSGTRDFTRFLISHAEFFSGVLVGVLLVLFLIYGGGGRIEP